MAVNYCVLVVNNLQMHQFLTMQHGYRYEAAVSLSTSRDTRKEAEVIIARF